MFGSRGAGKGVTARARWGGRVTGQEHRQERGISSKGLRMGVNSWTCAHLQRRGERIPLPAGGVVAAEGGEV